jgi:hypothetical protein
MFPTISRAPSLAVLLAPSLTATLLDIGYNLRFALLALGPIAR